MVKQPVNASAGEPAVVFLINSLEGGGAERVMVKALTILQGYFSERGWCVYLVLLDDAEQTQRCPDYVRLRVLDSKGSLLKGYRELSACLGAITPLLCFSFLTRANVLNALLSRSLTFRSIISERVNTSSHLSGGLKDGFSRLMVRLCYPLADRLLAVSEGVRAELRENFGLTRLPMDVIYNPFDGPQLVRLASEPVSDLPAEPYIIGVGRLTRNKNFALLLNAYARVRPQENLLILGQGEERSALQRLATQLGIADRVTFLGYKANPYPYIKGARWLVSPSNAEGFPNALVEAMCLGIPVLATNCDSGPAEIIAQQFPLHIETFTTCKYGGLCPTDDLKALALGLQAFSQPEVRALYAEKSRQRGLDFSYQQFGSKLIQLIERTLPAEHLAHV